jgi:hypothetical protein
MKMHFTIKEHILQSIYEIIGASPSIDTPFVCLELYEEDFIDPDLQGSDLAMWLHEWHREAWEITCAHVDHLVKTGDVIFTDDGNLYQVVYEGDIV